MKKHAIIPIFIPHRGCPHNCVFCNQKEITARSDDVSPEDVRSIADTWLSTLGSLDSANIEIAFYGGSFTAIPLEEQSAFLSVAKEYLDNGRIGGIHLSTRPDCIDADILDNLKRFGVTAVELGVQSFSEEVLRLSCRGHGVSCVYRACDMIRDYGFRLGIQLMIGLPGDSEETCIDSARKTAEIRPELARLYPTIVLDHTPLFEMYRAGTYAPLKREDAVRITAEMYEILDEAGIQIMRVGLKSSDIIAEGGAVNGGTYHPAFRQLVEGYLARQQISGLLDSVITGTDDAGPATDAGAVRIRIYSNARWFSNMIGNQSKNRIYFSEHYPQLNIRYMVDNELADREFRVERV